MATVNCHVVDNDWIEIQCQSPLSFDLWFWTNYMYVRRHPLTWLWRSFLLLQGYCQTFTGILYSCFWCYFCFCFFIRELHMYRDFPFLSLPTFSNSRSFHILIATLISIHIPYTTGILPAHLWQASVCTRHRHPSRLKIERTNNLIRLNTSASPWYQSYCPYWPLTRLWGFSTKEYYDIFHLKSCSYSIEPPHWFIPSNNRWQLSLQSFLSLHKYIAPLQNYFLKTSPRPQESQTSTPNPTHPTSPTNNQLARTKIDVRAVLFQHRFPFLLPTKNENRHRHKIFFQYPFPFL